MSVKNNKLKILIAPLEIAGIYSKLQEGFRELGIQVHFLKFYPDNFNKNNLEKDWFITKALQNIVIFHRKTRSELLKIFLKLIFAILEVTIFFKSIFIFNTYIFVWGISFFPRNLDLPILKLLNKRIIFVVGHGSEARAPYLSLNGYGIENEPITYSQAKDLVKKTKSLKNKLKRIEKYSDHVIGLPTTSHLLSNKFINFYTLGLPVKIENNIKKIEKYDGTTLIIHIPSKPEIKGSIQIESVMQRICNNNGNLKYLSLTNLPNSQVLEIIRNADLVIDQLWSDIPMAMIGVEAASSFKPSLTFGCAKDIWINLSSSSPNCSDGYFSPDEFEETVLRFATDPDLRNSLAKKQFDFVSSTWAGNQVASNYLKVIKNEFPNDWYFDPKDTSYLFGAGIDPEIATRQIAAVEQYFGKEALLWNNLN